MSHLRDGRWVIVRSLRSSKRLRMSALTDARGVGWSAGTSQGLKKLTCSKVRYWPGAAVAHTPRKPTLKKA